MSLMSEFDTLMSYRPVRSRGGLLPSNGATHSRSRCHQSARRARPTNATSRPSGDTLGRPFDPTCVGIFLISPPDAGTAHRSTWSGLKSGSSLRFDTNTTCAPSGVQQGCVSSYVSPSVICAASPVSLSTVQRCHRSFGRKPAPSAL